LLFVADLQAEDIFWLPLRDEIEINLDRRTPAWRDQRRATVHIPIENSLRRDSAQDWPGLRHYALEPIRQLAFRVMHTIHRQLRYAADFSPFLHIISDQVRVNAPEYLLTALDAAERALTQVLALDVVFGDAGFTSSSVAERMRAAIDVCQELRVRVRAASISPGEVAARVLDIKEAIEMISMSVAAYQRMRNRWVTFQKGVSRGIGELHEVA
jgi:hypothetical protein